MKRLAWPAIAAIGFVVSAVVCGWLLSAFMPGYGPGLLFMDAGIIEKLMMMLIVLLHLPILVVGLIAVIDGKGRSGIPLRVMAAVSVTLGGFAALYGVYTIQYAVARIGSVSFAVTAPGYAEAALATAMGFFAATLALTFHLLGDRCR